MIHDMKSSGYFFACAIFRGFCCIRVGHASHSMIHMTLQINVFKLPLADTELDRAHICQQVQLQMAKGPVGVSTAEARRASARVE